MNDFERLKSLEGNHYDENKVAECFINEINSCDLIINEIKGIESNIEGYGYCDLYNVYYDFIDSDVYSIYVSKNNVIASINKYS